PPSPTPCAASAGGNPPAPSMTPPAAPGTTRPCDPARPPRRPRPLPAGASRPARRSGARLPRSAHRPRARSDPGRRRDARRPRPPAPGGRAAPEGQRRPGRGRCRVPGALGPVPGRPRRDGGAAVTRLSPDVRAVVAAVDRLTTQVARLADGASAAVVDVSPGVAVVHGRPVDTPTTPPDDGPRCVCGDPLQWYTAPGGGAGWVHDPAPDSPAFDVHKPGPADGPTRLPPAVYDEALRAARRQAPAADEDAQRTTRRQSLRSILHRLSRGVILRTGEAGLHPAVHDDALRAARRQAADADEDAQRTTRRQSVRIILDRASRGVILRSDEAALLRQHVDAEQRDADTARQVAAGNLRHVRMLYADLQAAQAAIKRVRALRTPIAEAIGQDRKSVV